MKKLFISLLSIAIMSLANVNAQSLGNCDPDSLQPVTKTGIVMVTTAGNHTLYMLDENMDGTADFNLNFGPWWYKPDTGSAARPSDGDTITITGGLNTTNTGTLSVIVIYTIDGEFWRNPYNPYWNNIGPSYHGTRNSGMGYCSGWLQIRHHQPPLRERQWSILHLSITAITWILIIMTPLIIA